MSFFSRLLGYYTMVADATKELFIRILMGVLIFLGYVLLSLFIYAVMRRIMVPQKLHVIPVHLQYSHGCTATSLGGAGVLPCPYPRAEFELNGGKKLLSSGQYYSIAIELDVPESSINREMGVFMVNLTFYTTDNQFLSTSARPVMVRYKSLLLRTMYTLVFAVPLLLGLWEQKQVIELVLFESYYEPYGDGALSATVSIQSHDLQIYSTTLTVDANFSGFTYYLYQWPISMTVIVVISIFITLCTCTVLMWVRDVVRDFEIERSLSIQRRRAMIHQQQQQQQQQRGRVGLQVRELILRQLQRMTGSSSSEESQGTATPPTRATAETLASTSTTTRPGARVSRTAARVRQPSDALITPEPSATPTETGEESSAAPETDTGSEFSAGFNEMIGDLHSLRRDDDGGRSQDDDQSSTVTETSSADDGEGVVSGRSHADEPQVRQRRGE